MSPLYMNARCKKLLNILLTRSDYLTMNQLAQELGVSRRTAYYDVCKVNLWLEQAQLPQLEVVRGKGLFLSHDMRGRIHSLLGEDRTVYIYSPEERVKLIICCIIYEANPVYMEQLMDCCEVSRNTVFADLKEVTKQLEQYDLTLEYRAKRGYYVDGDPIRIRALFILYFNELSDLYQSGAIRFFNRDQIGEDLHRLECIQQELGIDYVDGVLLSLAALLPVLRRHRSPLKFTGLKEEEMGKTREFALVQSQFPQLIHEEQLYLTLHLLGSRVNLVPEELFVSDSRQYVYDLTKELISEFERVACIVFDNREELERALFVHLNTSLYRYRFGIQIGNLLGDDVMNEYPNLFALTKIAAKRLEESIGFPIPDSEVAYLVLHFGGFLKIANERQDRLRILIVCVNGISTGNMLKREVQKLLPFAEIVDVVAAVGMVNIQNICDLVISTVRLNCIVPVITVNPILTEFDRKAILNHRLVAPKNVALQRDRLFRVVKKYVKPEDYDHLMEDLTAFLQDGGREPEQTESEYSLLSVLDASRIRVVEERCSWQQSIRLAGACLLDHHSIEQRYLDTIIHQLQYYGPYMFLTEDVILAHAKPEDGVSCLDLSLAVFHQPVVYSSQRKAKLVLLLAAEDQEKHLRLLQDILVLISAPGAVERLAACSGGEAVLAQIRQILAQHPEEAEEAT